MNKTTVFLRFRIILIISFFVCPVSFFVFAQNPKSFSPEKADFSVKFKMEILPYKIMGVFVLPGESVILEMERTNQSYTCNASGGQLVRKSPIKWEWQAPQEHGLQTIQISRKDTKEAISLHVFVLIPYSELKGEVLNGYRIGKYPSIALKGLEIYKPPKGFIEVTRDNEETLVSPHFKLKQFLCKQAGGYPKYLVLQERLLLKLELILEKVNEASYPCNTFFVMSGYRTPFYNKSIGNVKYSRHVWGGAADIFIDANPKDEMMDDLNHDGKIDYRDAAVIYDIIDLMLGQTWYEKFIGGLGRYRKTTNHGPFVHVDVRGFRARWGK